MNHAIATLQIALDTALNNEPIHRAEGNIEQADACRAHIEEYNEAISHLTWILNGWRKPKEPETFQGKIARAINQHSLESGSDTPDFILAEYLKRCLENFDMTVQARVAQFFPRPVEQEYRMLEVGDVIQKGDEMFCYNKGPWEPALVENHGAKFHLGYVEHRRPLKRSLDNPPQSDSIPS